MSDSDSEPTIDFEEDFSPTGVDICSPNVENPPPTLRTSAACPPMPGACLQKRAVERVSRLLEENRVARLQAKISSTYLCQDSTRPLCRRWVVGNGTCKLGYRCRFYHPPEIGLDHIRETKRDFGYCYCGAEQRTLINTRSYHPEEEASSTFFRVCSRTGRSMQKCIS